MNYLKLSLRSIVFILVFFCKRCDTEAQVQVHQEPRHHPVFQNAQIRILNVLLPPGNTTQYHLHHTPSVFIYFTNTLTGSQLQGGTASTGRNVAGRIQFENLAAPHTRVHRVWNIDKDTMHVIDVELLFKDSGFVQKPLALPGLTLVIDTTWTRAYRLTLLKGNNCMLSNKDRSLIFISMDASTIQTKQNGKTNDQTLKPGSFFEIKRNHSFSLKNTGDKTIQFVLLELPVAML